MRKFVALVAAILLSSTVFGQQSIKSDNVGDFSEVNLSGKLFVEMIPSDRNAIEVELINSDITKFKWGVSNDVLSISLRPSSNNVAEAKVKIHYMKLSNLVVSGSEVTSPSPIQSDMLALKLSSGAVVTAQFECKDLELDVSSNSALSCSGTSKYVDLRATEKSRVDARNLECVSMTLDCATGAEIYVSAQERLVAYAKTGASVFYKGEPTILKVKSSKMGMGMGASVLSIGK